MARKKGGGGKLNRSAIIQARLDPKLHFAAETLARSQRRTLSSLIEALLEEAIRKTKIPAVMNHNTQIDVILENSTERQEVTVKQAVDVIWSHEEADCFAMFAFVLPDLMTADEACLWLHIKSITYFWKHFPINLVSKSGQVLKKKDAWPLTNSQGLVKERLREHWPFLKDVLSGIKSMEDFRILSYDFPEGPMIEKPKDYPHDIKRVDYSAD